MGNEFSTSVNGLIKVYCEAMAALMPSLDRVNIEWRDGSAYDDFDQIAECLFKGIVLNSLQHGTDSSQEFFAYGRGYDEYGNLNYIAVDNANVESNRVAFQSFQSSSAPMDSVKIALLDDNLQKIAVQVIPNVNLRFSLACIVNGNRLMLDRLSIPL